MVNSFALYPIIYQVQGVIFEIIAEMFFSTYHLSSYAVRMTALLFD